MIPEASRRNEMSNIRRIYYYIVSLVTLGILAAGIRILLFLLFETFIPDTDLVRQEGFLEQQLSLGLAMVVIGGPLWFFFWRIIQRNTYGNNTEIGSLMRQVYLNLILLVTSLMALFTLNDFLVWLMAGFPGDQNAAGDLATLLVVAGLWFYHWWTAEKEGRPSPASVTLKRWYVYIISAWGLIWLSTGIVQFIYVAVMHLPVWGDSFVKDSFWGRDVQNNLAWIILGGFWWGFHWFRMARGDLDSTLRQVYIYLLAIIGSSIAGLTALIITLYNLFVWFTGVAGAAASDFFRFLGWTIPAIAVTAAIWFYHRFLAEEEAVQLHETRLSSRRIHFYIMSFIGLGAMVAGLVILLGVLIDVAINSISPPIVVQTGWWQKQLSLCFALLIVAVPLWWYYWNQIIRLAERGGILEWRTRSRRTYLYIIIGAAIITLAADLVNVVYRILSGILGGNFGVDVLRNMKWSLQSLVVAIPLLVYHWGIAREDQRKGAEAAVMRKSITVLAGEQSGDLIARLERELGGKVHLLQYTEPETVSPSLTDEEIKRLVEEIESSASGRIMLVISEGKVKVFPYRER